MIKRQSVSMFAESCKKCARRFDCLSAYSIIYDKRKFFLKVHGMRQKATLPMLVGKEKHEERAKDYPSLQEMGWKRFQKAFYLGKKITLTETPICSPLYGLRGWADIFSIQFDKKNNMAIEITDLKSGWSKWHILQIATYGLILSDPTCIIHHVEKKRKKEKKIGHHLYPRMNYLLNINLFLENMYTGNISHFPFMDNNIIQERMSGIAMAVLMKAKQRRPLMKMGLYYLNELAPCKNCPQDENECSLYSICGKVNYEQEKKFKQLYYGKRELLIRSKPVVAR